MLAEEITQLGLRHRLVTQWTSFVAVSRKVVNPGGEGTTRDVAVPKVEGVSDLAYPESSQPSGHPAPGQPGLAPLSVAFAGGHFGGQAAPEPATWAAMLALGMAGLAFHRAGRGRRRTDG